MERESSPCTIIKGQGARHPVGPWQQCCCVPPVNVLDLREHDLQGAHEEDPGRLREVAGGVGVTRGCPCEMIAVRLLHSPACTIHANITLDLAAILHACPASMQRIPCEDLGSPPLLPWQAPHPGAARHATLCATITTQPEQRSLRDRHAGSQGVSYACRKHVDVCTGTRSVSQKKAPFIACMACTGLTSLALGAAEGNLTGPVRMTENDVHEDERTHIG